MSKKKKVKVLLHPELPRKQCVEECIGCDKVFSDGEIGDVCIAYLNPAVIHRRGCGLATNKKIESTSKKKVNPLKLSKRKNR